MRICVAFHACMDLGGIINHTEQMIGGLKDLGHQVDFKELVYADRANGVQKSGDFEIGPSGIPFNQSKGWNFAVKDRIAYKTGAGIRTAQQILNGYDLVIWTVPVPPKNKSHLGNDRWPELYALEPEVKQIAFIHDGNCRDGAPHLLHIQEHLVGLACVHGCALNGAAHLTVPRALVVNPQFNPIRAYLHWNDKRPGFVNMQTFKAWKHVHELIEAIAYMPELRSGEFREVAGRGIEYQYMTSEDKCKPQYFHDQNDEWFSSMKFWDAALGHGMTHHDVWSTDEVRHWLQNARVLVDPSWSKKYSQVGGHWNRVVVDAMINGAIPVAQAKGMGTELFTAGVHYVDLGKARDAQDYADIIMETGNMDSVSAAIYQEAARNILQMFDRRTVAQRIIDLANGELETIVGVDDPVVRKKYEDLMFDQYGVLV